jgi:hypothetical protein
MTPEQFTAILVALTGLLGAIGALFVQLGRTHRLVNSRMDELLRLTRASGVTEGQDRAKVSDIERAP